MVCSSGAQVLSLESEQHRMGMYIRGEAPAALCGDGVSSCIWIVVLATQTHDTVVNAYTTGALRVTSEDCQVSFLALVLLTQDTAAEEQFYIR